MSTGRLRAPRSAASTKHSHSINSSTEYLVEKLGGERGIHEAFSQYKLKPHTFFVGAAIEPKMASEIWAMLEGGILENAANLTDEDQIASITRWLCNL
ncbi:MAG: AvaI/BsoBI family type II restriction endonuclease [Candidatus Binatia bacterium]